MTTDNATNRQAAQILGIKKATDAKRAEVEARMAPPAGPPSATSIQAQEMLALNRDWDPEPELATGSTPRGRSATYRDPDQ